MAGGRPTIEIDLAEVERLASEGHTQEGIAINLGISIATLQRRKATIDSFEQAIKRGQDKCHSEVSNWLHDLCKTKNLGAIIWYEKTRRGLKEPVTRIAETDAEGNDKSGLTDDELLTRAAAVIAKRKANAT